MKFYNILALAVTGLLGVVPASAAILAIGQPVGTVCLNGATTVSRTGAALPLVERNHALASCNEVLADKIPAKDRIAALVSRGTIEAASGDINASLTDYDAALAMNPNMADVYIDRGAALMRAQRYEEARSNLDQAISLGTASSYLAYFDRGMAQEKSGNVVGAYHDYK